MLNLDPLLYFAGVSADYLDYSGHRQQVPWEVRLRILDTMALPIADQDAVDELVFAIDAKPWQQWVKPFNLLQQGAPLVMTFCPAELTAEFHWHIALEDGSAVTGVFHPADLPECGDYLIDGVRYVARQVPLPLLPLGYHSIQLRCGDDQRTAQLAVCPERCYEPSPQGDKLWGVSCQLYTLRSPRNWGIGDFLDLTEMIELLAPLGADVVGLNPFHAPCSDSPDAASPYSPSDRRFLNPLYIAPELVAEFSPQLAQVDGEIAAALDLLRAESLVNYEQVSRLKYLLYENLYGEFCRRHQAAKSARFGEFQDFIGEQGGPLESFCAYELVHNAYADRFATEPQFFAYLQWLAFSQLQHCQQLALAKGMKIGLMGDIAVGSVNWGNEVTSNPDIYRTGATIGAPPDPFSSTGQDWGLPVIDPLSLRQSHYRHFIQLLRANLSCYGAIRIDHAMSLMRLWWCLAEEGEQQRAGAYVYFHVQDMLALLRLESHRGHCQVIGEDLGVVPGEFRELMQANAMMGNTVFYFEQDYQHNFRSPHEHRESVALMVTNHDVPTLADWWRTSDIQRRFDLNVIKSAAELAAVYGQRQHEKGQLLHLLAEQHLLPDSWQSWDTEQPFDFELCQAIHRLCARSSSRWVLLQLEDLQLMTEPVNIPGTYREYPNWRRKQRRDTGDILADTQVVELLRHISQERISASS